MTWDMRSMGLKWNLDCESVFAWMLWQAAEAVPKWLAKMGNTPRADWAEGLMFSADESFSYLGSWWMREDELCATSFGHVGCLDLFGGRKVEWWISWICVCLILFCDRIIGGVILVCDSSWCEGVTIIPQAFFLCTQTLAYIIVETQWCWWTDWRLAGVILVIMMDGAVRMRIVMRMRMNRPIGRKGKEEKWEGELKRKKRSLWEKQEKQDDVDVRESKGGGCAHEEEQE